MSKKKVGAYILDERIGRGSFAAVWRGHREQTNEVVAIKVISRQRVHEATQLNQEVAVLKQLQHPNIVRFIDLKKSQQHYYLVLEFCSGGDVSSVLRKNGGRIEESFARHLLQQIASGLFEIHRRNYIHRDLKPQNLLLSSVPPSCSYSSAESTLKIADFGFARSLKPWDLAATICGSPLYMAPEILRHECYDAKADLWSVGTILFEMLHGSPPFSGQNPLQLLKNIEEANQAGFPSSLRSSTHRVPLSASCRDLLGRLLKIDPGERLSPSEFFCHPFVVGSESLPPEVTWEQAESPFMGGFSVPEGAALKEAEKKAEKKLCREVEKQQDTRGYDGEGHAESGRRRAGCWGQSPSGDKEKEDVRKEVQKTMRLLKGGRRNRSPESVWSEGGAAAREQSVFALEGNKTQKKEERTCEGQQREKPANCRERQKLRDGDHRLVLDSCVGKDAQTAVSQDRKDQVVTSNGKESGVVLNEVQEREGGPEVDLDNGGRGSALSLSLCVKARGLTEDGTLRSALNLTACDDTSPPPCLQEAECSSTREDSQGHTSSKKMADEGGEQFQNKQLSLMQLGSDDTAGYPDRSPGPHPLPGEKEMLVPPHHGEGAAEFLELTADRCRDLFATGARRPTTRTTRGRRMHRVSTAAGDGVDGGNNRGTRRVADRGLQETRGRCTGSDEEVTAQRDGGGQRVPHTAEYPSSFPASTAEPTSKANSRRCQPLWRTTALEREAEEERAASEETKRGRRDEEGKETQESVIGVGTGILDGKRELPTDECRETFRQSYMDRQGDLKTRGAAQPAWCCFSSSAPCTSALPVSPAAAGPTQSVVRFGSTGRCSHDSSALSGEEAELDKHLGALASSSSLPQEKRNQSAVPLSPCQGSVSTTNAQTSPLSPPGEAKDTCSSTQHGESSQSAPPLSLRPSAVGSQEAEERDYVLVASEDIPPRVSRRSLCFGSPHRYRPALATPFKGAGTSLFLPGMHDLAHPSQRPAHSRHSCFLSAGCVVSEKTRHNSGKGESSAQGRQGHRCCEEAEDVTTNGETESKKRESVLSGGDVAEKASSLMARACRSEGKGEGRAEGREEPCSARLSAFSPCVGHKRKGGEGDPQHIQLRGGERDPGGQGAGGGEADLPRRLDEEEADRPGERGGRSERQSEQRRRDDQGKGGDYGGGMGPCGTSSNGSGFGMEGGEERRLPEGCEEGNGRKSAGSWSNSTAKWAHGREEADDRGESVRHFPVTDCLGKAEERREKRKRFVRERKEGEQGGLNASEEPRRGIRDYMDSEGRELTEAALSPLHAFLQNDAHAAKQSDTFDKQGAGRSEESGDAAEEESQVDRRAVQSESSVGQEERAMLDQIPESKNDPRTGEKGRQKGLSGQSDEMTRPRRVSFASPPSSAFPSPQFSAQSNASSRSKSQSFSCLADASSMPSLPSPGRARTTSAGVGSSYPSAEGEGTPPARIISRTTSSQASLPGRRIKGSVSRHVSNLTTVAVEFLALAQQLGMHAAARRCHEERCKRRHLLQLTKRAAAVEDQGTRGEPASRETGKEGEATSQEKEGAGTIAAHREGEDTDATARRADGPADSAQEGKPVEHEKRADHEETGHAGEVIEEGQQEHHAEEETSARIAVSALSVLISALRLLERALAVATDESTEAAVRGAFREALVLGKWCACVAKGPTQPNAGRESQAPDSPVAGPRRSKECDLEKKEDYFSELTSSRLSGSLSFPPSFFFLSHGTPTCAAGASSPFASSSSLCFHHLHCQNDAIPFPFESPSSSFANTPSSLSKCVSPGTTPLLLPRCSPLSPPLSRHPHVLSSPSRASPFLSSLSLRDSSSSSLHPASSKSLILSSQSPRLDPLLETSSFSSSSFSFVKSSPPLSSGRSSGASATSFSCLFNRQAAINSPAPKSASSRPTLCPPPSPLLLPSSVLCSAPCPFPSSASSSSLPASSSAASRSVPPSPSGPPPSSLSSPLPRRPSSSVVASSSSTPSFSCLLSSSSYPPSPSRGSPGPHSGNKSTTTPGQDGQVPSRDKQHGESWTPPSDASFPPLRDEGKEGKNQICVGGRATVSSVISTIRSPFTAVEAASDVVTKRHQTPRDGDSQEGTEGKRGSSRETAEEKRSSDEKLPATTSEGESRRGDLLSRQLVEEDNPTGIANRSGQGMKSEAESPRIFIFGRSSRENTEGGGLPCVEEEQGGRDDLKRGGSRSVSAAAGKGMLGEVTPSVVFPDKGLTSCASGAEPQTSGGSTRGRGRAEKHRPSQTEERRRCPLCCLCFYCKEAEEDVFSRGSVFCLGDSVMPPLPFFGTGFADDSSRKTVQAPSCPFPSTAGVASSACGLLSSSLSSSVETGEGDGVCSFQPRRPLRSSSSSRWVAPSIFSSSSPVRPLSPALPRLHVLSLAVGRLRHLLEVNAKQLGTQLILLQHWARGRGGATRAQAVSDARRASTSLAGHHPPSSLSSVECVLCPGLSSRERVATLLLDFLLLLAEEQPQPENTAAVRRALWPLAQALQLMKRLHGALTARLMELRQCSQD